MCFGVWVRYPKIVSSPKALHASSRCKPCTRTKRSPSGRTRMGTCCPFFERCAAFYRHVDVRDRKFFSPHHGTSPKGYQQHTARGNNLSLRNVLVLANSALRLSVPIAREVVLPSAKRIPL